MPSTIGCFSGVVVQILVAVAMAALMAWVGRAAEVAGQAWRRRRRIRSESAPGRPRPVAWLRPALLLAPASAAAPSASADLQATARPGQFGWRVPMS
jgi:hypothetical protein